MPAPIPDLSRDQQCHHYQAPSGQRCGSPAIKGEYYCYHHLVKTNYKKQYRVLIDPEVTRMELPEIEDRASIFVALAAVVHRLAENTIDTRRAGQMIYGLQVAMRALEPPRIPRTPTSPGAPEPALSSSKGSSPLHRDDPGATHTASRPNESDQQASTRPPDEPAPKTIQITKEGLIYFLRSRHCYHCNAELFPPEELTYRRNPGAPPEIIEESNPRLPGPTNAGILPDLQGEATCNVLPIYDGFTCTNRRLGSSALRQRDGSMKLHEGCRTLLTTRREFLLRSISTVAVTGLAVPAAEAISLHCTPAPTFPVPMDVGTWRSPEFPVGKHDYHVSFIVDRTLPLDQLDCDLGPETFEHHGCATPPLLDVEWNIWDGRMLLKCWHADPVKSSAWAATETSCFLGDFEGKKNGMFTLEWIVRKDPGRLRELHPRIEIVKNPGYWCWL